MKLTPVIVPFLALLIPAFGQQEGKLNCDSHNRNRDYERSCEMRETRLPATQRLEVLAAPNGGVSILGWNRPEILVRARVEAQAKSEGEAKALASQVQVQAGAGRVTATGPDRNRGNDAWWSVSYEVFVPHRIDLKASSVNGGVHVSLPTNYSAKILASTSNGGLRTDFP